MLGTFRLIVKVGEESRAMQKNWSVWVTVDPLYVTSSSMSSLDNGSESRLLFAWLHLIVTKSEGYSAGFRWFLLRWNGSVEGRV